MTTAVRYLVSGRVQNVGFRYFTVDEATRARLNGRVRNLPDGRVEAIVEGPSSAVEEFAARLWEGPPAADVTDVTVEPQEPLGHKDFRVD